MIPANNQRGMILFEQRRYRQAAEEFKRQLGLTPDDCAAHGMLSLCLIALGDSNEAMDHAGKAIHFAPDRAFGHSVMARVLMKRRRLNEALASIKEAIRLNPGNGDFFGILAAIQYDRCEVQAALESADGGLAVQPDNGMCLGLRAMALAALGDSAGASAAMSSALAMRPDHAYTHACKGWAMLQLRRFAEARTHFREALRIDPEFDWARTGMIEALKSRNVLYRTFLGKSNFAPMFNIWLRMDTFGRHLLSSDQVRGTNLAIAFILSILACISLAVALRNPLFAYLSFVQLLTLLQAGAIYICRPGRQRRTIAALTTGLLVIGWGMGIAYTAWPLVLRGILFFWICAVVQTFTVRLVRASLQY